MFLIRFHAVWHLITHTRIILSALVARESPARASHTTPSPYPCRKIWIYARLHYGRLYLLSLIKLVLILPDVSSEIMPPPDNLSPSLSGGSSSSFTGISFQLSRPRLYQKDRRFRNLSPLKLRISVMPHSWTLHWLQLYSIQQNRLITVFLW